MFKKYLSLIFFTAGLWLIDACVPCSDVEPYFDYSTMDVLKVGEDVFSLQGTTAELMVAPVNVDFLATTYMPTVTNMAFGTSCADPGDEGAKYPITGIDIVTLQDFDANHPAGSSLGDLFYLYYYSAGLDSTLSVHKTFTNLNASYSPYFMYSFVSPQDTSQLFDLKVVVNKSNGTKAEGTINGFKFK